MKSETPSEFDLLVRDLDLQAARREHDTLTKSIHQAMADHLPAFEVAKLEVQRHALENRIASLGGRT